MPDRTLPEHDNFILLETAYLLLHAAHDIICSETGDLYSLLRTCGDQETQKRLRGTMELLNTGIGSAFRILDILLRVDKSTWEA